MYLTNRFYTIMITAIVMMAVGNYYPPLYTMGCVVMWFLLFMTITDLIMMYSRHAIHATRQVAERMSNGDGGHAHPSQTMIDLMTIRQRKGLRDERAA